MGKLIELLNEYNEIHNYAPIEYYDDETNGFETNYVAFYKTCIIISKQFGFIKWLVENDKIDTSKANDKNLNEYEIELRIRAVKELVADSEEKTVLYLNLLMLLSISDTPIEDLLLYLK